MKNNLVLCLVLVLALGASAVSAQKIASTGSGTTIAAAPGAPDAGSVADGTPDSMVSINLAGVASWDEEGDPSNDIINQLLGAGAIVTGLGAHVTVTTVGASWLSEVSMSFGVGGPIFIDWFNDPLFDGPGTASGSTGGIIDLSDNGLPNLPADAAGNFPIEMYEDFDDVPDAIDANYDAGNIDVEFIAGAPVPTMPEWGMIVLLVALLAFGTLLLRRRARQS